MNKTLSEQQGAPGRSFGLRPIGRRLFEHWEEGLAGLALIVVVGSVGFGIASRALLLPAATWTVELSTLAFTWAVFFGAAGAFRRGLHVRIDTLVNLFSPAVQTFVAVAVSLLVLAFLLITFYFSILLAISAEARPSPILRIPFTYVYGAVVVSLGSMIVHLLAELYRRFATGRPR